MLTYNNIIQLNREFADAHRMLNNFGNGWDFDIVLDNSENAYRYPIMWMVDLPSPIDQGNVGQAGLETFAFEFYFLQQVEQLEHRLEDLISTNRNEVISDMRQCAVDLLSYWKQNTTYKQLRFNVTSTITVLEDYTPDHLYGVKVSVNFQQIQTFSKCIIPMSGIDPPPSSDVSIYGNDTLMVTVACGDTYEFQIKDQDGNIVGVWNPITKAWIVNISGSSMAEITNSDQTYTASFDTADNPFGLPDTTVTVTAGVYTSPPQTFPTLTPVVNITVNWTP